MIFSPVGGGTDKTHTLDLMLGGTGTWLCDPFPGLVDGSMPQGNFFLGLTPMGPQTFIFSDGEGNQMAFQLATFQTEPAVPEPVIAILLMVSIAVMLRRRRSSLAVAAQPVALIDK